MAVPIPEQLPAVTPKSQEINDHQLRFSDTSQHEHLHSNIHPSVMSFTDAPFPDVISQRILDYYGRVDHFRDRETIRKWIASIFERPGNRELLQLGTTVERAEKKAGEWVLTLRTEKPDGNHWWQERFDALVVASGHYNLPWFPNLPGLIEYDRRFPGRVIHAKHFRGGEKFKDKV